MITRIEKFSKIKNRLSLSLLSVLLISVVFTGCKKDKNETPQDIPAAGLMVANLSPDLAATVSLDGNYLNNNPLGYNNYTGGYLGVYTGNRNIRIYDAYTGALADTVSQNFMDAKYYSLFLLGTADNYQHLISEDKFDDLTAEDGKAYVRYVNAIMDSSSTNVSIRQNGSDLSNESADYAHLSAFMPVNAGSVDIMVKTAGNEDRSRTLNFESRKVYTILLIGSADASDSNDVEIRFIENGMLDADTDMMEIAANRSVN